MARPLHRPTPASRRPGAAAGRNGEGPWGRRPIVITVCAWCAARADFLGGCGGAGSRASWTATVSAPTTEARAAILGATATANAAGGPPGTPGFFPAKQPSVVAAAAATPILAPSPTRPDVPKEGTPSSIPGATGLRISVGERRLWIACRGEGSPTVVMDAGVNSGSQVWSLVWPATAASTRVCVYDRTGLGYSDPIPGRAPARKSLTTCIRCCATPASPAPTSSSPTPSAG